MTDTTVPAAPGLLARLFTRKPSGGAQIADPQLEAQVEELRRRWEAALKLPAHEYLRSRLEAADLPVDVAQVEGRTCSFWAKEDCYVYGVPLVTTIVGLRSYGQGLYLGISSGPEGERAYLIHSTKGWRCYEGSKHWPVLHFQIL